MFSEKTLKMKVLLLLTLTSLAAPSLGITINTVDAKEGELPYMVSLKRFSDFSQNFQHSCGGFIVSPSYIITTASCLYKAKTEGQIVAGLLSFTSSNAGGQKFGLDKIIIHPDYDTKRADVGRLSLNDIALVKLSEPAIFNDVVQAIKLPEEDSTVAVGSSGVFAGWGTHLENGWEEFTKTLQVYSNYTVIDYETCLSTSKNIIQNFGDVTIDKDLTFCTGPLTDKDGVVNTGGDVGGPLVQDGVAVGVYSWSINYWSNNPTFKGKKGPAGVYTSLNKYVAWIKENVDDL